MRPLIHKIHIFFRFQIHIPENYPDGDVPKIVFENTVFHPSIDPATHVLNVKQVTPQLTSKLTDVCSTGLPQVEAEC